MKTNKTAVKKSVKSSRKVAKAPSPGRGRPAAQILLVRAKPFTINSLYAIYKQKFTRATIGNHLSRALEAGKVKIIGKIRKSVKGASTRQFATVFRKPRATTVKPAAAMPVAALA